MESDSDTDDEFVKIYREPGDAEAKVVNGLMTADLTNYDVITDFPHFANNIQVIRMSTNELDDIPGENSKLPNSFCSMKCLKELFLFGDAVRTGVGLSTLPKHFGNLKSLEVLNLEHNCFQQFPEQICQLTNLKKLYLNGCGLTWISPAIKNLYNLLEVDLSDNDFSSGLCKELFDLPKLKDLYLINCKLTELPKAIGNLEVLEGLRLNDNFLTEFPDQLYSMKYLKKLTANKNHISKLSPQVIGLQSLKMLLLSENYLTSLPDEISKLPCLHVLNVFGNRLTCLPDTVKDLDPSTKIIVHGNYYMLKPPLSICSKGIESIKGFFTSMAKDNKKIHSDRIKIVMLGEAGAGKTSLTEALVFCRASESKAIDSTIGVEIYHCPIADDGLEACIVDCAGQRRYQLTHPFFLSEEALHILVVNLNTYKTTQKSFEENVEDWIKWITARLWKPRIMIVATHRDECKDDEVTTKCDDILTRIQDHEKYEIKRLDREIKAMSKRCSAHGDRGSQNVEVANLLWLRNNRPFISSKLLLFDDPDTKQANTTCLNMVPVSSKEELKGMILLRKEICRVARYRNQKSKELSEASNTTCARDALFPLVGIDLPSSWIKLEKAIKEYRENIHPSKVPCMTYPQFEQFANDNAGLIGSEVLSGLNYLDSIGEIKFYGNIPATEYSVFLDLPWLCKLVKLLFRHDYEEVAIQFQEEYSDFGMEMVKFENHLSQLKRSGVLSVSLLRCIWIELQLNDVEFPNMIKSLVRFGLACEIPQSHSSDGEMFIPWFLHSELKAEIKEEMFPDVPPTDIEELRLKFCICGYLPAGLFDRLCVRSYALGIDVCTWKNSMLIYIDDIQIYLEVINSKSEITVIGRTKTEKRTLWTAILDIVKELRGLLSEWPRLVYNTYTVCPHCTKKQSSKPFHFECKWWKGEGPSSTRCKKSSLHKQVVDLNLLVPPKELLTRREPATVSVLVTDTLLRELSKMIPDNWETLSTFLGLSHEETSTIKRDNPGVREQAYAMLHLWKTSKGKGATRLTLIEALKKSDRSDLESMAINTA